MFQLIADDSKHDLAQRIANSNLVAKEQKEDIDNAYWKKRTQGPGPSLGPGSRRGSGRTRKGTLRRTQKRTLIGRTQKRKLKGRLEEKGLFFNSKICRMDIRYFEAISCPNLNGYGYVGYKPI